jgi:Zn-dependent protease with chaperone function
VSFAPRILPALGLACALIACGPVLEASVAPRIASSGHPAPVSGRRIQVAETARHPAQPRPPAYNLPSGKLAKAIALGRIRTILHFGGSIWGLAVLWLLLSTRIAAGLQRRMARITDRRWLQGVLFFAALLVLLEVADLPLGLYAHHVSLAYGIGVQGWPSWLLDQAKGLAVTLGSVPFLLLFNWIVRVSSRRYWLWSWLVTLPILVLSALGEPLLEPIFNKFEPLSQSNPALVARLETVVARTGTRIPPERMFLMKASLKTNGLNAYVTGIGATKRIVVWDTTAGRIPDDEILFIFAHESGHYVLNHIPKGLAASAVFLFFVYWACSRLAGWMALRFGQRWGLFDGLEEGRSPLSSRAGFVLLLFIVSLAGFVLEPVDNTFSRYIEHQADVYGQEAIHTLVADPQKTAVSAFDHLGEAWLEDPNPGPFLEFWTYSHPSTQHRAAFAAQYDPWTDGGRGQFFAK